MNLKSRLMALLAAFLFTAGPLLGGDLPVSKTAPTGGVPASPIRVVSPGRNSVPGGATHGFNGLKGDRFRALPYRPKLAQDDGSPSPHLNPLPASQGEGGIGSIERGDIPVTPLPEERGEGEGEGIEAIHKAVSQEARSVEAKDVSPADAHQAGQRVEDALLGIYRRPGESRGPSNGVGPASGGWEGAIQQAALTLRLDPSLLKRAIAAAERDIGSPFRAVMGPEQFRKYLVSDASFRERYLLPLRNLPQPAAGEGDWRPVIARVAKDQGVSATMLLFWMRDERLGYPLKQGADPDVLETQLYLMAKRKRLDLEMATWPHNRQGEFLRALAEAIGMPSGNSIEEIMRAGAFAYVTFNGRSVMSAGAGRDPDFDGCDYLLYVTRESEGWKMGYYPCGGSRRQKIPAPEAVSEFKKWLKRGVPQLRLVDGFEETTSRLSTPIPSPVGRAHHVPSPFGKAHYVPSPFGRGQGEGETYFDLAEALASLLLPEPIPQFA